METNDSNHPSPEISGIEQATRALVRAKEDGCALLILTGAGMSVASGVPVFRHADGTMSAEFLAFLDAYNQARERHNLSPADDWFEFSVSDMFRTETAVQAWAYWKWRILRARIAPGDDYQYLDRIMASFEKENCFVITSNCDGLHRSFVDPDNQLQEIHGSLAKLQCSGKCCQELWDCDDDFVRRLQDNKDSKDWVPMCPNCQTHCLRPNVMIFNDRTLVHSILAEQQRRRDNFLRRNPRYIVLEIGAGVVVSSIRQKAEYYAEAGQGVGLVRINPSASECQKVSRWLQNSSSHNNDNKIKYWPVVAKAADALAPLAYALEQSD